MAFTDGVQIEASSAKTATGNGATQNAGDGIGGTTPSFTFSASRSVVA